MNIEQLKRAAKKVSRAEGMTHTAALDLMARIHGFKDWASLMKAQGASA